MRGVMRGALVAGAWAAWLGCVTMGMQVLTSHLLPPHILLVEDEPLQRELMAESLSLAGYEVTATCTGDEAAILLADRGGFDALLTDVAMPGRIDGIGLAEHAREVHPDLPVLFVSGGAASLRRAGALPPPTACILKPFETGALLHAVRALMAGG